MTRGKILHLTRAAVVDRWLSQIPETVAGVPIAYLLEDYNGGFNPEAEHCASIRPDGTASADCIGFVLWGSGIDRKQPGYNGLLGEWLNCRSLLADAMGGRKFCRRLLPNEKALPGDWLLTQSHIGGIIRPATRVSDVLVVDCSPRHGRPTGINTGGPWSGECRVIRPTFYAE